ncbi:MAG: hypothetical protein U0T11_04985 [Chitinophagaceae bacterium]
MKIGAGSQRSKFTSFFIWQAIDYGQLFLQQTVFFYTHADVAVLLLICFTNAQVKSWCLVERCLTPLVPWHPLFKDNFLQPILCYPFVKKGMKE